LPRPDGWLWASVAQRACALISEILSMRAWLRLLDGGRDDGRRIRGIRSSQGSQGFVERQSAWGQF